jgi:hypothetical protein
MENMSKHIKVGEMEIPINYFSFSRNEKEMLCLELMDAMLHVLDRELNQELDRVAVLDRLLESSIITNQDEENYEICEVLKDIRILINE